jgi:hypothetical protein
MNLTKRAFLICLAITTAIPVILHLRRGALLETGIALFLGLLWLATLRLRNSPISWLAFLGFTILFGLGVWQRLAPLWLLLGQVAALATWDLSEFSFRLDQLEEPQPAIESAHLKRLAPVVGVGFISGWLALGFTLKLNFNFELLLGLLAFLALAQIVRLIRRLVESTSEHP